MLYFFYFAVLICPNTNIYSQDNCHKKIFVEEHAEQFVASFPFPKITKTVENKHIEIPCDLYKQISVGDKLYSEQVKEFLYDAKDSNSILPHGQMKKKSYIVLNK